MKVYDMTRKDFESLPYREWDENIGEFDTLVILPLVDEKHDSGYQLMEFVACRDNIPICRLSGCSDVLHLDGIGGYGKDWLKKHGEIPDMIKPIGWSIDCLPNSGLLRLFSGRKLSVGVAVSSFEVFSR